MENSCGWLDESKSVGENNFSESETVDSEVKIDQRVHTFREMDTPDCCLKFLTPCYVEELYASDAVADLDYYKKFLHKEFFKRLGVQCEKREDGSMVVTKKLLVSLNNELFLVEFYVNPDENEWEPNVILGIPFLRLARSIVDFANGLLTIWPDATIIDNDLQNLDELFAGICEDDLPPLLDNTFTIEAPEFECKMGKSKRVKNKPQPIYKMKYGDEGPSLTINRPITRDELTKEEMEVDVYDRIMLLNEKRPIIETLKHQTNTKRFWIVFSWIDLRWMGK